MVVDKPVGPTSHDVVDAVRRALGVRRVGHTGTLDPFASGVLPVCVGQATRLARFFTDGEKAYRARVHLGFATDTDDLTGTPLADPRPVDVADDAVRAACAAPRRHAAAGAARVLREAGGRRAPVRPRARRTRGAARAGGRHRPRDRAGRARRATRSRSTCAARRARTCARWRGTSARSWARART